MLHRSSFIVHRSSSAAGVRFLASIKEGRAQRGEHRGFRLVAVSGSKFLNDGDEASRNGTSEKPNGWEWAMGAPDSRDSPQECGVMRVDP